MVKGAKKANENVKVEEAVLETVDVAVENEPEVKAVDMEVVVEEAAENKEQPEVKSEKVVEEKVEAKKVVTPVKKKKPIYSF